MKTQDLRQKSVEELNQELIEQLKADLKLRMQNATGQIAQTHQFKQIRRDIARIKTVLNEMQAGNA